MVGAAIVVMGNAAEIDPTSGAVANDGATAAPYMGAADMIGAGAIVSIIGDCITGAATAAPYMGAADMIGAGAIVSITGDCMIGAGAKVSMIGADITGAGTIVSTAI